MNIVHELIARTTLDRIYQALTVPADLAAWFTPDIGSEPEIHVGSVIEFRFRQGIIRVEVAELEPDAKVVWKILSGLPGWEGVTGEMIWQVKPSPFGAGTMLHFTHTGWLSMEGPYPSTNFKIATLIDALKSHAETGILSPA
ncbi:MAG: SRPBCC domain-containing protein [Chloroflexota bacterium]